MASLWSADEGVEDDDGLEAARVDDDDEGLDEENDLEEKGCIKFCLSRFYPQFLFCNTRINSYF